MTLGPGLLALAAFDRTGVGDRNPIAKVFVIYGRVPLFYYLVHLGLIHAAPSSPSKGRRGSSKWTRGFFEDPLNLGLPVTHLVWALVVGSLYRVSSGLQG